MRGQIELPMLGVAFVLLVAALMLGVTAASSAFSTAERSAVERQTAVSISETLAGGESTLTSRENVLRESSLDESSLLDELPIPPDTEVRVELEGQTLLDTSDGVRKGGTTIERIVLVENRTEQTLATTFEDTRSVTLPRRSFNTTLTIQPPAETTVRTVRANERTILKNDSGLEGSFDLSLSSLETTTLWFEAAGEFPDDSVIIEYEASETHKSVLAVTVYE